jgi:hypothetical protein
MTGKYLGTKNRHQSDDTETLYMDPSWYDEGVQIQSVAISPLVHNETSIVFYRMINIEFSLIHFVFTEDETDMIIEALIEVKKRWGTERVIG